MTLCHILPVSEELVNSYSQIHIYIYIYTYNGRYLHFLDYCPHLRRHVYHKVSVVVRFGLLQLVGMSSLTLYFAYRGRLLVPQTMFNGCQLSPVNFPAESSPLLSSGIELTLFGYVTGSNQRLYPLYHVFLRTSVYENNIHNTSSQK